MSSENILAYKRNPQIDQAEQERRYIAAEYGKDHITGDAFEALQRLAGRYPDHVPVLLDLAAVSMSCSEYATARSAARKLLELAPDSPDVLDQATEILNATGDVAEARAAWARFAETRYRDCAYTALAGGALRVNRLEEACEWIEKALQASGKHPMTLFIAGQIARKIGRSTEAEQFLAACSKPDTLPIVRFRALYELGELYDQLGQLDAAVGSWREAKQCVETAFADRVSLSRKHRLQRLERNRETIARLPASACSRWRKLPPNPGQPPMAILAGHPRSGTTLLEQMLAAHPAVVDLDEMDALNSSLRRSLVQGRPEYPSLASAETATPIQWAGIRTDYLRRVAMLHGRVRPEKFLLDKNPNMTDELPLLLPAFPGLRLLIARRDPRDVVLSCFRLAVTPEAGNVGWLREADAVEDYRSMMGVWESLRDCLEPGDDWMEVSYEALCRDVAAIAREVTSFLGLEWHPGQEAYRDVRAHARVNSPTHAEVRATVSQAAIGRWRRYANLLPGLFEPFEKY